MLHFSHLYVFLIRGDPDLPYTDASVAACLIVTVLVLLCPLLNNASRLVDLR